MSSGTQGCRGGQDRTAGPEDEAQKCVGCSPGSLGEMGGKRPVPHQQVDGCLVEPGRHGMFSESPRVTAPGGTDKSTWGIWGPLGQDEDSSLEGPPELEGKSDGHEDSQSHP